MNLMPNSHRGDLEERTHSNRRVHQDSLTQAALATNGDDTGDCLCKAASLVEVASAFRILEDKKLQLLIKRQIDIWGALLAILVLSPICFITAILIRSTSSGPAVFKQSRIGRGQKPFIMYKFRTMCVDPNSAWRTAQEAEAERGLLLKAMRDPRVTRVGGILRATSLDELPQLFNVLKGDMSLVGPRPLPVRDYNGFDQDWHRRRLSVRPGITCLWQINGRSSIPFEKWMELDMEYIDHWSLWLDFKILTKTIPAVLNGSGAR